MTSPDFWAQSDLAWAADVRRFRQFGNATQVRVLMWGPGRTHRRRVFRERLAAALQTPTTIVAFSEGFPEMQGVAPQEVLNEEYIQAETSDLVVVLLTLDPRAQGAEEEVRYFARFERIRRIMRIIVPETLTKVEGALYSIEFARVLQEFIERNKHKYVDFDAEFDTITSWANGEIERCRTEKFQSRG